MICDLQWLIRKMFCSRGFEPPLRNVGVQQWEPKATDDNIEHPALDRDRVKIEIESK